MMENFTVSLNPSDRQHFRLERARTKAEHKVTKSTGYYAWKRFTDIVLSLCAIIVLAIPMAIIALLVFLQDGHSPFFIQDRLTKDGKHFKMYKFRTMVVNADQMKDQLMEQNESDGPTFKMKKDPRITPIGAFLRKTSLDEIPQFFNVLGGSMSLVGPRPPVQREVDEYTKYQMHRLDCKTGITCYWQCSGRSNIGFDEWVEMDLKYIREQSVKTDIQILWKTVKAVVKQDGAE